ncbi:MAG: class I SAM-dependent methyltransferase [Candidatus Levybacteria bacterium]|nr:class I SAM-dependent methyltransferase [Candidatus Levybacteria bacterium]
MHATTDNYRKHKSSSTIQQKLLGQFNAALLEEAKKLSPKTVLDVGCGEGFTLEKLRTNGVGERLEGVDFLDRAIELGKKEHPKLKLKQGTIYDLDYKDNSFDLVICSEVLEHVDDPEKALKELVRVSKKYCLLSVPNEPFFMLGNFLRGKNLSRFGNDIEHINHWTFFMFRNFVSKYLVVKKALHPIPWTLIVAEKK